MVKDWDDNKSGSFYQRGSETTLESHTGALHFRVANATKAYVDDDGQMHVSATANAAKPGYTFSTDTNTGMYHAGADALGLSTGGTARIYINANGQVGITETNPQDTLHIDHAGGTGGNTLGLYANGVSNKGNLYAEGDLVSVKASGLISGSSTSTGSFGRVEAAGRSNFPKGINVGESSGTTTQLILNNRGTQAAPAIAFSGDENTGIYQTTDNQLSIGINNNQLVAMTYYNFDVKWNLRVGLSNDTTISYDGKQISGSAISTGSFGEVHTEGIKGLDGTYDGTLLIPGVLAFGNDTDSMLRRRTSNDVEFRMAGTDIVRINTSGLQVENGSLEVESGNVIASGNISGSVTSTGSFGTVATNVIQNTNPAVSRTVLLKDILRLATNTPGNSIGIQAVGHGSGDYYIDFYNYQGGDPYIRLSTSSGQG